MRGTQGPFVARQTATRPSPRRRAAARTSTAAAAERKEKHTRSFRRKSQTYGCQKSNLICAVRGSRGKRRSAAGGGKSEAVSRKRRDWRARRGAGIAVPRRWKSPLRSLGVSKGPFSTVENGPFGRAAVRRQIPRRPSGGRSHSIASLRLPETSTSFFGIVRLSTPSL